MIIRPSTKEDLAALEVLYPDAFPQEDLLPLVRAMLSGNDPVLSFVAQEAGAVLGHVAFTHCSSGKVPVALLGPLCVASGHQRRGVGAELVRKGLERLAGGPTAKVLVLGDPAYYSRFGFAPERFIDPPYKLPAEWVEAWQSLALTGPGPEARGVLSVPAPWRDPALWGP